MCASKSDHNADDEMGGAFSTHGTDENSEQNKPLERPRRKWQDNTVIDIKETGCGLLSYGSIRGCIQKFPDWPPEARTSSGTALCH
jgi:hypothetical protein